MKTLRLLWSYSSGVRLAALILLAISCYALYTAVDVVRYLKYSYDNYAFIRDTDLHGAYSFAPWYHPRDDEEWEAYDKFFAQDGVAKLLYEMEAHPAVEALGYSGGFRASLSGIGEDAAAISDPDKEEDSAHQAGYAATLTIRTVNPGMFAFFPNLKELFRFKNPRGVYMIGDGQFPGVGAGDTLHLFSPARARRESAEAPDQWETAAYPAFSADLRVEGRYPLPFCMPQMTPGGSGASEESIVRWVEKPFLLMLDTAENRAWLASLGFSGPTYGFEFYIRYNENASKEEIAQVKSMYTPFGGLTALEEVQEELAGNLKTKFLNALPGAILRCCIMLLCYVSLIVLTVSKKRKEVAVSYICGATKEKTANLLTLWLFLVTVPAGILSLLYIYTLPSYARERLSGEHFSPSFANFQRESLPVCLVFAYFALMLLVGWTLVRTSLRRRCPIDYFKEETK